MFELKIGEEIIKLKWGTYAMKIWCDLTGKEIDDFFKVLSEVDESPTQQMAFDITRNLLRSAYQCANKKEVSDETVCDWLDSLGGIVNVNTTQLVDFINYVIKLTMNGITPLPNDLPGIEKKNED